MTSARNRFSADAIVLRTFDVGEADRFCILLTPTHGRLAARASGARKTGSKLGPILLALQHIRVDLAEHTSGIAVQSAQLISSPDKRDAHALSVAHEAVELVLRLTEDAQESGDLFLHCSRFLSGPQTPEQLLPFSLNLLSILGVLPLSMDDPRYAALSHGERTALHDCLCADARVPASIHGSALREFVTLVLHDHLRSPLVAPGIRAMLEMA